MYIQANKLHASSAIFAFFNTSTKKDTQRLVKYVAHTFFIYSWLQLINTTLFSGLLKHINPETR